MLAKKSVQLGVNLNVADNIFQTDIFPKITFSKFAFCF